MVSVGESHECLPKRTFKVIQTGVSCKWTTDSQRLILLNFDEIRHSPIGIYRYILPFCPSSSWLHECYPPGSLQEVGVILGRPEKWGICSRVVPLDYSPEVLACWKDMVAVGLSSGDIFVLDTVTGSRKSIFSEHNENVTSLAFSLDGTMLVSGSEDGTIKLWDIQTGGVVKTFFGKGYRVHSVSISPDAVKIAAGSQDSAICLWDVRTGKGPFTIKISPQPAIVTCVDFHPTIPGRLVSASASGFVQEWGINGNRIGPRINGRYVAFSSDGSRFVLWGRGPPSIQISGSGATITILSSPAQDFSRCCFSPSGEYVAGVSDGTIYVWDTNRTNTYPIETLVSDGGKISSLLYSSSIISAHSDKKIRFWQVGGDSTESIQLTTANTKPTALAAPADITCITLQSKDSAISVDSAGTVTLWDLSNGLPETLLRAFRPRVRASSVRLVDGVLIIVFYEESSRYTWKISTWHTETGEYIRTIYLSGTSGIYNNDLTLSEDGTILFAVDWSGIRTWSTLTGEVMGSTRFPVSSRGFLTFIAGLTPSPEPVFPILVGPTVWIYWSPSMEELQRMERLGQSRPDLMRSVEGIDLRTLESCRLESCEVPGAVRLALIEGRTIIADIASGTEVFKLPGRFVRPSKARWSGRYLTVAYYETGELFILDLIHLIQ